MTMQFLKKKIKLKVKTLESIVHEIMYTREHENCLTNLSKNILVYANR